MTVVQWTVWSGVCVVTVLGGGVEWTVLCGGLCCVVDCVVWWTVLCGGLLYNGLCIVTVVVLLLCYVCNVTIM